MSDFLTNLVARTFRPPALRPRPRARFEGAEPIEEVAADPPPVPHVIGQAAAPPSPAAAPRRIVESHVAPPVHRGIVEARRSDGTPRETRESEAAPSGKRRDVSDGKAGERTIERERIVAAAQPAIREVIAERTAPSTPPPPAAAPPREVAIIERHSTEETLTRVESTRIESRRIESTRIAERRREIAIPPRQAPPEPVIHVSIGRVEVRASPPAAPAQRPRAQRRTAMTIEEYAARRTEKDRR